MVEYFLSDEPLADLNTGDAFDYGVYTQALLNLIRSLPNLPGRTIGLFGSWGVGKSTIINDLEKKLPEKEYSLCKLDGWTFTTKHFRREFLLSLYTAKDSITDKYYIKESEIENLTRALNESVVSKDTEPPKFDLGRLIRIGIAFLATVSLFFATTALAAKVTSLDGTTRHILSAFVSVFGIMAAAFALNLKGLLLHNVVTYTTPPPVHPDEFRKLFTEFVGNITGGGKRCSSDIKTLVIVIDNLDRCEEPTVLEILSSIKTFLQAAHCIFLLPADYNGLIAHIDSSYKFKDPIKSNEYLRKFFFTSITMRPLISDDMDSYIMQSMDRVHTFRELPQEAGIALPSDVITNNYNDVLSVLRAAVYRNPRRIIHLINKISGAFLLAVEISKSNANLGTTLLGNLGFLAKIIIIEENWPHMYRGLTSDPDLYNDIIVLLNSEDAGLRKSVVKRCMIAMKGGIFDPEMPELDRNSTFMSFLRWTDAVSHESVQEFILFRHELLTADGLQKSALKGLLLRQEVEPLRELISDSPEQVQSLISNVIDIASDEYDRNRTTDCITILRTCLLIYESLTNPVHQAQLADGLANLFIKAQIQAKYSEIGPEKIIPLISHSRHQNSVDICVAHYIALIDPDPQTVVSDYDPYFSKVRVLHQHRRLLGPGNSRKLMDTLNMRIKDSVYLTAFQGYVQTLEEDIIRNHVPHSTYTATADRLKDSGDSFEADLHFLVDQYKYFSEHDKGHLFLVMGHIAESQTGTLDAIAEPLSNLLAIVESLPDQFVTKNQEYTKTINALTSQLPTLGQAPDKRRVTYAALKMLPGADESALDLLESPVTYIISSSDQGCFIQVLERTRHFIAQHSKKADFIKSISEKFNSDSNIHLNDLCRTAFFKMAKDIRETDHIGQFVLNQWTTKDGGKLLSESLDYLPKSSGNQIVGKLLEASNGIEISEMEPHMEAIAKHVKDASDTFRNQLFERFKNDFLLRDDLHYRRATRQLWKLTNDILRKGQRTLFYTKTLQQLTDNVVQNELHLEQNVEYLEILRDNSGDLTSTLQNKFVNHLLGCIEVGNPADQKKVGFTWLRNMVDLKSFQKKVPAALLKRIAYGTEQLSGIDDYKEVLQTLLKYKPYLNPDDLDTLRKNLKSQDSDPDVAAFLSNTGNE